MPEAVQLSGAGTPNIEGVGGFIVGSKVRPVTYVIKALCVDGL